VEVRTEIYLEIFDSHGNIPATGSKLDIFFETEEGTAW
jgi:hypothetical protein